MKDAVHIKDKEGERLQIAFEAVWRRRGPRPAHLAAFEIHLKHVAPSIARGIAIAN